MKFELLKSIISEKRDDGEHELKFKDPHAEVEVNKARGRYAYMDNDVEAFVKMMQDEEKEDHEDIEDIEDRLSHDEKVDQSQFQQLEKQIANMQQQIDALQQIVKAK